MKTLTLIQGSPEWHAHRATACNASDTPAMLGISKYKSRNQLIKERAIGVLPEIDAATQRLFNDGHKFEALARPLAEEIIGDTLSPVTGVNGKFSASFDGITFDESIIFEHKTLNNSILNDVVLDEQYRAQMEHQLLVSGAEKCLFMATKFDANDQLVGEPFTLWYEPDLELRARIVAGWEQFAADVAAYVPTETVEAPKAEAIIALPSVFVQATGMVTASNLTEFKEAATTFIANINTELVSDEDFANAEATVKFCKDAETNLESTKASVLAQMSTVDEVVRTLDHIKKQLADKRLMLDKLVKSEKENRKGAIVTKADKYYTEYAMQLEAEIKPIGLNRSTVSAARSSFSEAIKGLKSLSSMQEKVDTALRNAKFAADQEAADIRKKLAWCKESSTGFGFLFSDLSQLIASNGMEAFQAIVNGRIDKHKAEEAAKAEALRAAAKMDAEINEEKATLKKYEKVENLGEDSNPIVPITSQIKTEPAALVVAEVRPSRQAIIESLAYTFSTTNEIALEWILAEFAGDIKFNERKAA